MTEISWPTPFGYTDFCDDLRHEILGKITAVGVYTGGLKTLGPLPLLIPKLCLWVHYFESMGDGNDELELRISLPGQSLEEPIHRLKIAPRAHPPVPSDGEDRRAGMHLEVGFTPLIITELGFIRVRMYRGDDVIRLGSLEVTAATPEEMSSWGVQVPLTQQQSNSEMAPST